MKKFIPLLLITVLSPSAFADSFWNHNGSTMRLVANGNQRVFVYETPSRKMYNAGIRRGQVLFDGYRQGQKYYGTARVFSKNCRYDIDYKVSGNVYDGPKVVLQGSRESYDTRNGQCRPTGRITTDKLVFTYLYSE